MGAKRPKSLVFIYFTCLSVCLSAFVSNKRQNGWTERAQFCVVPHLFTKEGLKMIKILKFCLQQNVICIKENVQSWNRYKHI